MTEIQCPECFGEYSSLIDPRSFLLIVTVVHDFGPTILDTQNGRQRRSTGDAC
jgi:hypothetical protein